jgi:plastocyanin
MTDTEKTETSDKQRTFASFRRDVLKAVGAGSALGIFGGTAAAANGTGGITNQMDDESADEERTVHTVRTRIGPSTNPKRPADFYYQPTGLSIETGDVVKFVFETPDHTVTSYHPTFGMQRRIPPGEEAFSSPVMGWDPESLPDDIDMPPAEDGTIGGDGEMPEDEEPSPPEEDTETTPADDEMETTPATDETETTPVAGGEADENATTAPGENDTEAPGGNETDEPIGTDSDTVSTPDENAQVTPGNETEPPADDGTTTPADGDAETPVDDGTTTPEDDGIGTPTENGTETPSDGEPAPSDGEEEETEPGVGEEEETEPGAGEDGTAQPSVWLREFDTPGVYDIECAPHETYGMAMRIVVGEETNPNFETSDVTNLPEARVGPAGLARQVLTDPELEPGAIVDAGRVMWEDLQSYNDPEEDGTEDGAPEEETPGEEEPGEAEPGEEAPEETPGEAEPGEGEPGETTPGEVTPDEEPIGAETENGTAPGDSGNETVADNESSPV